MPRGKKTSIQVAFGNAVRKVRKEKGIAQEKLASLAGINRGYMGDVERGERNLALQNMGKIANALGVRLSQLIRVMEKEVAVGRGSVFGAGQKLGPTKHRSAS